MKYRSFFGTLVFATVFVSGCASQPAGTEKWSCTAPGLVTSTYSGGKTAFIHLSAYQMGGSYSVVKDGNKANGKTADGTSFVCTKVS